MRIPIFERLCKRLLPGPNGCLEWQGYLDKQGYGTIGKAHGNKGIEYVHRVAWEEVNGPIPDGLCILHTCDNPPCCEPTHLWLGTRVDNMADMCAKGRSKPVKGEQHGFAKLNWPMIEAIRADNRSHRKLAEIFGVCYSNIGKIKRGEAWKES